MEQVLDWLNENELRAYPLLDSYSKVVTAYGKVWQIPDNLLLDLQLVVNTTLLEEITLSSGATVDVPASARLQSLVYTQADEFSVTFGTASSEITVFTIPNISSASFPLYVRNHDGCLCVLGEGVKTFLAYFEPLQLIQPGIPVEPSTVVQFNDAWLGVHSITTSPEKISKQPDGMDSKITQEPILPLNDAPFTSVLTGDVYFLEGYNFRVNILNNLIDLEISTSYGLNMNCATHFLPPQYADCDQLVSYINGIAPDTNGNFKLNAGANIVIKSGKEISTFSDNYLENSNEHTLFVGLSFQSTDLCAPINVTPTV